MNVRTLLPLLWLLATPLATEHALVAQEAPTAQAQPAPAQAPALHGQGTSPGATQLPAEPIATPDTPLSIPPIDRELPAAAEVPATGAMATIDRAMGSVNAVIAAFFFFDVLFWDPAHRLPLVVLWLVLGAIYFTIKMGFINFRAFGHAIQVVRGKYSNPADVGEVSHFQALSAALSATVGLGNIAGVAIAVSLGGPGATFWMIIAGLLGMSAKFAECTLGQQYREVRPDGRIMGGAMFYLSKGLAEKGMPGFGKFLAVMFAILCIGGSLGGGNSFQVNQSLNALQETVPILGQYPWVYGLIMTVLVGVVIIGGIRRIATVAEGIVPLMCGVYVLGALYVILTNVTLVPAAFAAIFTQAFNPDAAYGGFIGALVVGFQRAAFSNEAGAGSAAIAHAAARTEYPVREGIVALLEPFIDTVVVCTMTALVIVITGAYNNPAYADLIANSKGAALTSRAMSEHLPWFRYVLSGAVLLFAYSTMISWSYYGERCWAWMFGDNTSGIYRGLFLVFVFLGSIITSTNVLDFGDLMILGMAFPNVLGVVILSGNVKRELNAYWAMKQRGELRVYT
ncbi:MAG: alanine:cation symporter family protein [Gemmatimonadota bacterium]|nr:alanine:cation symporter family protein [Gemmatimonadota bacterium]